tara:strand:+ start:79002 stop:79334 length:333 start_codon:yes stop_codon:yes gene_type:complete
MRPLFTILLLLAVIPDFVGCASDDCHTQADQDAMEVADALSDEDVDAPDGSWHDQYIADNCARCPDCCVDIGDADAEADAEVDAAGDANDSDAGVDADAGGPDADEEDAE